MTGFKCSSGLLSMILVLVASVPTWAAPLPEREGMTMRKATPNVFSSCKDTEISTYAANLASWEEVCRPTHTTTNPSKVGLRLHQPDLVWGEKFSPAQLRVDHSSLCLSRTEAGPSDLTHYCQTMGMHWLNFVTDFSTTSETFQSLYEFDLPENKFPKEADEGVNVSYSGRDFLHHRGTLLSDGSGKSTASKVSSVMQLLQFLFPEQGPRNHGKNESGYQIEVSDTLTKFIPKSTIQTRNLELGDWIPLLLFIFVLPDYKKLCRGQVFWGTGLGSYSRISRAPGMMKL